MRVGCSIVKTVNWSEAFINDKTLLPLMSPDQKCPCQCQAYLMVSAMNQREIDNNSSLPRFEIRCQEISACCLYIVKYWATWRISSMSVMFFLQMFQSAFSTKSSTTQDRRNLHQFNRNRLTLFLNFGVYWLCKWVSWKWNHGWKKHILARKKKGINTFTTFRREDIDKGFIHRCEYTRSDNDLPILDAPFDFLSSYFWCDTSHLAAWSMDPRRSRGSASCFELSCSFCCSSTGSSRLVWRPCAGW